MSNNPLYQCHFALHRTWVVTTKEQWLQEGINYYNAEHYTNSLLACEQTIQLDPSYARAYYGKGNILYTDHRYEEALAAYDQAIELDPSCVDHYYKKGSDLLDLKREKEAFAVFDQAIRSNPHDFSCYEAASSRQEGPADRGSTRIVGATFGLALLALLVAPFLNRLKIGRLRSERLAWSGIMAMIVGLTLRIWASRVLGAFYTRTLRTGTQQHLITKGPYRLVRHTWRLVPFLY